MTQEFIQSVVMQYYEKDHYSICLKNWAPHI